MQKILEKYLSKYYIETKYKMTRSNYVFEIFCKLKDKRLLLEVYLFKIKETPSKFSKALIY